jgi:glycosyltransferase involved in cell wall biosynthesis
MTIIFISPMVPYPLQSGDALRIYHQLRHLARRHAVILVCVSDGSDYSRSKAHLEGFCREVQIFPRDREPAWFQLPGVIAGFLRGVPFKVKYGSSRASRRFMRELTEREPVEAVICSCIETVQHLQSLPADFAGRTVLDLQNVSFFQCLRIYRQERLLAGKIRQFLNWFPFIDFEPRMAAACDAAVVVSDVDRQLLSAFRPLDNLWIAPNGVDVTGIPPIPSLTDAPDILYLGSLGYPPNAEAAITLAREIMPLIRRQILDARLAIVGRNPPPEVLNLNAEPGVSVHADVPEVAPYYRQSRVLAVPLKAGGGTRLKILEAMAYGLPVVSSSIGCEGIEAVPGRDILVADEPGAFAEAVVGLLRSPEKCRDMRQNARQLVEERYDWDRVMAVYDDILAAPRRARSKEGMR